MMECAKNITVIVPTLAQYAALERLFDQLKYYGLDFIAVQASGETAVLSDGASAGDGLWLKAPGFKRWTDCSRHCPLQHRLDLGSA